MEDEIKTWLSDIKQAIVEINDFLPDKKNFFHFKRISKQKEQLKEIDCFFIVYSVN
jgi:hypothetical protein